MLHRSEPRGRRAADTDPILVAAILQPRRGVEPAVATNAAAADRLRVMRACTLEP